ncbi:cop9 signalosome subunit 6 [Colletotrichum kahawae]|uniref:COP9 signalosome complex subunit 6 n=1 Tax=Colletotrichum kahawae TaxID=34407 RepID=A0AAE0CXV9_COLKA|nr:cop9 signalosome subunit 6 [Colletotrichum kahawae]
MASSSVNPLMSSQKSSELQAVLHPLVLLTISDYITRHTLRSQAGPIVGALLGQQNGREVSIEHAFECHIKQAPEVDGGYLLDSDRFGRRLEQSTFVKLVHKDRGLDLVGWYTLLPSTGPTPTILPIHNQVLADFNESALLLGFHPQEALSITVGGKLPMTILESNYEVDDASKAANDGEDKKMEDGDSNKLKLRFRELPYTVETGEAEMISMDHVARGAGNATAIEAPKESKPKVQLVESGGKRRVVVPEGADKDIDGALSPEEEEMIASLTAKANAVKMLQGRIRLITSYLERLPSEYLPGVEQQQPAGEHTTPSHTILRQIQALVNRLELVVPSDIENFEKEVLCEENDVAIVSRLNDLMQSISGMRDLGKKFGILEVAKNRDRRAADFTAYSVSSSGYNVSGVGDVFM